MKIGMLSKKSGLSTHTIRYYEKIGLLQTADKDICGHRVYVKKDLNILNWIAWLKNAGMSLGCIKESLQIFQKQDINKLATLLETHLSKLETKQKAMSNFITVTARLISVSRNATKRKSFDWEGSNA